MKNIKKVGLLLLLIICSLSASAADNGTLVGRVIDIAQKSPLIGATVTLEGSNKGGITSEDGSFTITGLPVGKELKFTVAFIGYQEQIFVKTLQSGENRVGRPIFMKNGGVKIDAIKIQGSAPTAMQIGDTTQFNAGAYKSNPDATAEDLIAKMPGFTVEDGKVEAQGEKISQVYVDGKAFFKDDPVTALNSLPADAIEGIQLFDEQSDMNKFTGVDDGNRTKTINIVTKAKRNNMAMGDFSAGYATDNRYSLRANVNLFRGDHRLTIGLGANNINQPATQGGKGRFYGRKGQSGIESSIGARINYSGDFKKDATHSTSLGFSYLFDYKDKHDSQYQNQQSTVSDYNFITDIELNTITQIHNMKFDLESNLGEKDKIVFRPKVSFTTKESFDEEVTDRYTTNILTNHALTNTTTDLDSYNIGGNLTWMHRFTDRLSTVVEASANISHSATDKVVMGETSFYELAKDIVLSGDTTLLNQTQNTLLNNNKVKGGVDMVYRLNKNQGVSLGYNYIYSWSDSDKRTYLYDQTTGEYSDIDDGLSNTFSRDYITNNGELGYSLISDKGIKFSAKAGYQNAALYNERIYPTTNNTNYTFESVVANMRLEIPISSSKRFMLSGNARPDLPTITQLQDIVDNSNPLKVSVGNPDLDKSYVTSLFGHYISSDIKKSTSLRIFGNVVNTQNYITNNLYTVDEETEISGVLIEKGAQVSTPVNSGTYWRTFTGVDYSFPINALKSKMNTTLMYSFSSNPAEYEGVENRTTSNMALCRLNLISNISENIDFTIGNVVKYTYTLSNFSNSSLLTESASASINWIVFGHLVLNCGYSLNYYKYSNPSENNVPMTHNLNAGLGYKFLDNNAEVRVSGYDLLNQNRSYTQQYSNQFITDTTSDILQRYVMLTFSYKFNTMKSGYTPQNMTNRDQFKHKGGRPPMF